MQESIGAPQEPIYQPSEVELRLISSDLEDCEEVWMQELSDYMLETRKRTKQVDGWFNDSCIVSAPLVNIFSKD